jgi:hypothetical protein
VSFCERSIRPRESSADRLTSEKDRDLNYGRAWRDMSARDEGHGHTLSNLVRMVAIELRAKTLTRHLARGIVGKPEGIGDRLAEQGIAERQ